MLQTLNGDSNIPSDFSFLSPPVFIQPLPDPPPTWSPKQRSLPMFSPQQELFSMSSPQQEPLQISSPQQDSPPMLPPSIILHDTSPDSLPINLPAQQQSIGNDSDMIIVDDLSTYSGSDYTGSGLGVSLPPSSEMPTELSSAVVSDSDPPLPSSSKSLKPVQQSGLLNFFPIIPADEAHTAWSKRKRDNQDRDEEERAEVTRQQEGWKEKKLQTNRERNRLAQQKHRKKVKEQKGADGEKVPVSVIFILRPINSYF